MSVDRATVEGRAVAYRRSGTGAPTVVLIAGSGSDHTHFDTVFDAIADLRTTVAYDRVGLGASDPLAADAAGGDGLAWRTRELHALLETIGAPKPYVVVGHSLGALLAQLYAVDFPADVAGIVSIDGDDGIPTDLPPWPEFPPEVELQAMERLLRNKPASMSPPVPEHRDAIVAEGTDRDAGLARLAAARRAGAVPDVPFVHLGATDHFFGPPELAPVDDETIKAKLREKHERTVAAYPRGRFVEAARSGHYVQFDEPELVVRAIAELLGS